MSKPSDLTKVSLQFIDNRGKIVIFCNECQKQLKSYRIIRYHFDKFHDLTPEQFGKVSKIGRLLGVEK